MSQNGSEPEWSAEHQNRERGTTTFETCGWCEHIGCGSFRYNCAINASCNLLPDYGPDRERRWDSKCYIKMLGVDDIGAIVRSKERAIKNARGQIKSLEKEIFVLGKLATVNKPPLPNNRPYQYYNAGDIVWVFHEGDWRKGAVVAGYRHHDGCVSYVLDDYPAPQKGWGCGCSVPCVLKEWEFDYFFEHPSDFDVWLNLSDRKYNGKKLELVAYKSSMARIREIGLKAAGEEVAHG